MVSFESYHRVFRYVKEITQVVMRGAYNGIREAEVLDHSWSVRAKPHAFRAMVIILDPLWTVTAIMPPCVVQDFLRQS